MIFATELYVNLLSTNNLILIYFMLFSSFIVLLSVAINKQTLSRLLSSSSFAVKISLIIISYGIFINDWNISSIGAITLIVGDAGFILLSLLYGEDYQ